MAGLSDLIIKFMQEEYLLAPSQESLDIITGAGFRIFKYPAEQFNNLENVERNIGGKDQDTLIARIFALSFPYEYALRLSNEKAMKWAAWLGAAEYRLGRTTTNAEVSGNLFKKALGHFLDSRQKGDSSKENASYIGNCYFRLGEYRDALPFFLESRQKGNSSKENAIRIGTCYFRLGNYQDALAFLLESRQRGDSSKENAGYIGDCCFRLGQFEKGINEYEMAIELAKQGRFDANWVYAIDNALEVSFWILQRARETIQSPAYDGLLQRFQALYENFTDFWKANEPNAYFRLMPVDGQGKPANVIGNAIASVS